MLPCVQTAINRLEGAGYACHVVGGCVRDSLLGLTPHDWDLTTNALPECVAELFSEFRVIPTGMKHGTVTVIIDDVPLEITTYRVDGEYRDHRHPTGVCFVSDITEDLRRRDFTVNAMAWNPQSGLCDPFGGENDLKHNILRCVGDAETRFEEDALRILRALRFAATYGFTVEDATAKALFACAPLLQSVAAERVQAELNRLLVAPHVGDVLRQFATVLYPVLPELQKTEGVLQYNPYHDKDVLGHTIASLEAAVPVLPVRLALLLHDCGKPEHFEWIREGFGHFPNHPEIGAEMAKEVLRRLRYDNRTVKTVCNLIRYHDSAIPETDAGVRRWIYHVGEQTLRWLLDVKTGDCKGHAANIPPAREDEIRRLRARIDRVVAEGQCTSLSQLALDGDRLLKEGFSGPEVGRILQRALDAVIDGECPNDTEALLAVISQQKT